MYVWRGRSKNSTSTPVGQDASMPEPRAAHTTRVGRGFEIGEAVSFGHYCSREEVHA